MGDPGASGESRQRPAKRTRRVALDDQQVRANIQQWRDRRRDPLDVLVRVGFAGAIQMNRPIAIEPVLGGIKRRMLAGENQARLLPARGERVRDWGKLDRFGAGADDQPYVCRTQPSP